MTRVFVVHTRVKIFNTKNEHETIVFNFRDQFRLIDRFEYFNDSSVLTRIVVHIAYSLEFLLFDSCPTAGPLFHYFTKDKVTVFHHSNAYDCRIIITRIYFSGPTEVDDVQNMTRGRHAITKREIRSTAGYVFGDIYVNNDRNPMPNLFRERANKYIF